MSLINPVTRSTINPDDYQHTFGYDGSNNLITDQFTDGSGNVWLKTYAYTGSNVNGDPVWVKQ